MELELCAATNSGARNGANKSEQKDGRDNQSLCNRAVGIPVFLDDLLGKD